MPLNLSSRGKGLQSVWLIPRDAQLNIALGWVWHSEERQRPSSIPNETSRVHLLNKKALSIKIKMPLLNRFIVGCSQLEVWQPKKFSTAGTHGTLPNWMKTRFGYLTWLKKTQLILKVWNTMGQLWELCPHILYVWLQACPHNVQVDMWRMLNSIQKNITAFHLLDVS